MSFAAADAIASMATATVARQSLFAVSFQRFARRQGYCQDICDSAVSRLESGRYARPTQDTIEKYALAVGARVEIRVRLGG
jgi:hypothetical protein